MSDKPIFAVQGLTKSYQGKKPVLNDISLVFLEGAKIGVIGQSGAGKSTLLRIMAATTWRRRAARGRQDRRLRAPGAEVDRGPNRRENVEKAEPIRSLLKQHEDVR